MRRALNTLLGLSLFVFVILGISDSAGAQQCFVQVCKSAPGSGMLGFLIDFTDSGETETVELFDGGDCFTTSLNFDADVDITNPTEVLWALATRWDPKTQTDIVDGCWTGHIDPVLQPEKRAVGDITNSRVIIYAVRPYHWREEFPRVNQVARDYAERVVQEWASRLDFLRDLRV